jgi:hypothetical protein
MLFNRINNHISVGIGTRLCYLKYGSLDKSNNIINPNTIYSYAPQASVKWQYKKIELIGDA